MVEFLVKEIPPDSSTVTVHVIVTGRCNHASDSSTNINRSNRRRLVGSNRLSVAKALDDFSLSAREHNIRLLANMTTQECSSGNTTACQTPAVLRQAVNEFRKQKQLDPDIIN